MERETSAKNKQILKKLLADPGNKTCADCKTATHPRWASWNLGIFLCIRCSGVHRSLGTHISKVRSVDLDSWSDMHLKEMVRWGNKKANLYWEAGLPPNYIPDESKIVNFIRTKYDLKRWVASPNIPDPASLGNDAGGVSSDDVPLSTVKQQQTSSIDLLGFDSTPAASKPTASRRAAPSTSAAAPPSKGSSLVDFDDFSSAPAKPAAPLASKPSTTSAFELPTRTASAPAPAPAANQRTDLKKTILSLYAQNPQPVARSTQPSMMAPVSAPTSTSSTPAPKSTTFDFDLWSKPTPNTQKPAQSQANTQSLIDGLDSLSFGSKPAAPSQPQMPSQPLRPTHGRIGNPPTGSAVPSQPTKQAFVPEEDELFDNPWK